jgi:hypothetical protein
MTGCESGASVASPAQMMLGARISPGIPMGAGATSVHGTLGYARSIAGGVEGEADEYLNVGAQLRRSLGGASGQPAKPWLGGEAQYSRRETEFDDSDLANETVNGWTVTVLAGLPLLDHARGVVNGYVAAGINKYGGAGFYGRVGIDIQPAFLRR